MNPESTRLFLTARDTTHRLTEIEPDAPPADGSPGQATIRINPDVTYQRIEGFGGAFTEAAATTWLQLPEALRAEVISAYFDPAEGHGYTLGRTHINSCDFALGNYACCDREGDTELSSFQIERERKSIIPMIKAAQAAANRDIKLLASPWSPPGWMKTTGVMNWGGKLKAEYRDAWAHYYGRFIDALSAEGIPIWGVTVQNEPAATQSWDSCIYTAEEERDFVRDHLGPIMQADGHGDVRIVIWDHNRDHVFERASAVLSDPEAAKYIWGTGFHWYGDDCFGNLQAVHDAYPDKALLFTEGCQEGGPHIGSWDVGERYGHSIINDLNHWTVGWLDWNLLLNEQGGPNHVGNYCSAPIIADTENERLLYQSSYYYLGHISRFVRPGAMRIQTTVTTDALEITAFQNPDGTIAAVVMNGTDDAVSCDIVAVARNTHLELPAHAIATCLLA